MSRLDRLAPDDRAALELLLRQGLTYDDLAELLGRDRETVRDQVRLACAELVPEHLRVPLPEQQGAVVDFLLGQGGADVDLGEPVTSDWARAVAQQLRELSRTILEQTDNLDDEDASRSEEPGEGRGRDVRDPELFVPFVVYLVVIVSGLAFYTVVGLTHH